MVWDGCSYTTSHGHDVGSNKDKDRYTETDSGAELPLDGFHRVLRGTHWNGWFGMDRFRWIDTTCWNRAFAFAFSTTIAAMAFRLFMGTAGSHKGNSLFHCTALIPETAREVLSIGWSRYIL